MTRPPDNIGETEVKSFHQFENSRVERKKARIKNSTYSLNVTHTFLFAHTAPCSCICVCSCGSSRGQFTYWRLTTCNTCAPHTNDKCHFMVMTKIHYFFLRAGTLDGCCQMLDSHDKCHFVIPMCAHANKIRGRPLQMCDVKEEKYFQTVKVEPQNDSKRCNHWRNVTVKHSSLPSSFVYTSLRVSRNDRHSATLSYLQYICTQHIYICMFKHLYEYMCVYIYIHSYVLTHTRRHIHMYMYV